MKRHAESHLDHGLNEKQLEYIFDLFKDRREFFKTTIELPAELGTVPCGLWGPAMDDGPIVDGYKMPPGQYHVPDDQTTWTKAESDRSNASVMVPSFFADGWNGAITFAKRGARSYESRLVNLPMRLTNKVFIVAGPHEEHPCIVYTMYGGPEAPQEATDPNLPDNKREASIAFWAVHALSRYS